MSLLTKDLTKEEFDALGYCRPFPVGLDGGKKIIGGDLSALKTKSARKLSGALSSQQSGQVRQIVRTLHPPSRRRKKTSGEKRRNQNTAVLKA